MPPPKPAPGAAVKAGKDAGDEDTQAEIKLTKAQQKALKFKDKAKKKGSKYDPDGGDVPLPEEDADTKGEEGSAQGEHVAAASSNTSGKGKGKGKGKAKVKAETSTTTQDGSNKRKRDSETQDRDDEHTETLQEPSAEQNGEAAAPKKKKRRKSKSAAQSSSDPSRPRLIVFVGNMSFKVTSQQLASHFGETCGETPTVRLLTRKVEAAAPPKLSASKLKSIAKGKASGPKSEADSDAVLMGKDGKPLSKGCAFLEFTTASALQKALRFHHTQFGGRQINVELTAGGGGKSTGRVEKIKAKNTELESERKKLHDKFVAPAAANKKAAAADKGTQGLGTGNEGNAQWGLRGGKGVSSNATKAPSKSKKWTPSGANATRLTEA